MPRSEERKEREKEGGKKRGDPHSCFARGLAKSPTLVQSLFHDAALFFNESSIRLLRMHGKTQRREGQGKPHEVEHGTTEADRG
jgi:hypothetical protein